MMCYADSDGLLLLLCELFRSFSGQSDRHLKEASSSDRIGSLLIKYGPKIPSKWRVKEVIIKPFPIS